MNRQRSLAGWPSLLLWFGAVIAIPAIPLVLLGWYLEPRIEEILGTCRGQPYLVGVIGFTALLLDVFLPIPSSFVCTFAGQVMGLPMATLCCFAGMQLSSWLGWEAGRRWGPIWIELCCGRDTLRLGEGLVERWGSWSIAITRPIPLIAEAVTLLIGTHPAPYIRWLPILAISNLSLALAWCGLGAWSYEHHLLVGASLLSVIAPVGLLLVVVYIRQRYFSVSKS